MGVAPQSFLFAVHREKFPHSVSLKTFLLPLFLKLPHLLFFSPHSPPPFLYSTPPLVLLLMAKGDRWTAGRTVSGKPNTSRVVRVVEGGEVRISGLLQGFWSNSSHGALASQ